MVPPITHVAWTKLITGEKTLRCSNTAINMLLFNAKTRYKLSPSPGSLEKYVAHAHEFFVKFEYCLKDEIQQLLS